MSFSTKKVNTFSGFLPAVSGSKGMDENMQKEREITFHTHFSYDRFTSVLYNSNIPKK